MNKSKADNIGNGVFLICIGALFYFNWWWPGIIVAIWVSFATRQILARRMQDFLITTILLLTLFIVAFFRLSWEMIMPILFVIGGGFLITKEIFFTENNDE